MHHPTSATFTPLPLLHLDAGIRRRKDVKATAVYTKLQVVGLVLVCSTCLVCTFTNYSCAVVCTFNHPSYLGGPGRRVIYDDNAIVLGNLRNCLKIKSIVQMAGGLVQ